MAPVRLRSGQAILVAIAAWFWRVIGGRIDEEWRWGAGEVAGLLRGY